MMKVERLIYYWSKFLKKIRLVSIRNSFIHKTSKVESGTTFYGSYMDKCSFCGYDCEILDAKIGKFCSIANNVSIGSGEHPLDWVGMSPVFYAGKDSVNIKYSEYERNIHKKTIIGNDVWIGKGALIKAGVTIGDGAVIGMGAVVTKNVEPYSIVVGIPAKHIKYRFSPSIIERLINLKWWDFEDDKLRNLSKYIKNPEKFIEEALK